MRRSKPVKIGDLWSGFVESNPVVTRRLCEARIPEVWPEIVGEPMAALTSSLEIKSGVLHIAMSSSVARQEIFMRRARLKDDINKKLGMAVVRNVIVK